MKTFTSTIIIAIFTITAAFATIVPEVIMSNEELTIVDISTEKFITSITSTNYNSTDSNLEFVTDQDISVIQIYNEDGVLEFQLPVMSKNVKINKNLFEQGEYKLGFLLKGNTEVQFTQVNIK